MPRPSREVGDVYEHARRAIEYTLRSPRRKRPAAARGGRLERRHRRARRQGQRHQRVDGLLLLQRARRLHSDRAAEGRRGLRRDLRGGARGRARRARERLVGRSLRARFRRRRPRRRRRQRDDDRLGRLFRRARIPARADRARGRPQARSSGRTACCSPRRRSSSTANPIPAASPTIRPACARTAASTAMARPGSSTASSSSPRKRATTATSTRRASSPRAPSRFSRRSRR